MTPQMSGVQPSRSQRRAASCSSPRQSGQLPPRPGELVPETRQAMSPERPSRYRRRSAQSPKDEQLQLLPSRLLLRSPNSHATDLIDKPLHHHRATGKGNRLYDLATSCPPPASLHRQIRVSRSRLIVAVHRRIEALCSQRVPFVLVFRS
uniref:Uncharacterized protein n=1 Tax=Physcomitrium patens TaxID=3218 RepID=A0A2K1II84_PHYPA|nr:hypothetical protein PHYPA_027681 [Physcomitrium patens]